jgi:hypothetical protein
MKTGETLTIQLGFWCSKLTGHAMLAGQEVTLEKRANSILIESRNLTEKHVFEISDSDLKELIEFLNRAAGRLET